MERARIAVAPWRHRFDDEPAIWPRCWEQSGPAMFRKSRAVTPPGEAGDANGIVMFADPLPTGGGSFLVSGGCESKGCGDGAKNGEKDRGEQGGDLLPGVGQKPGGGRQDLAVRTGGRDGEVL